MACVSSLTEQYMTTAHTQQTEAMQLETVTFLSLGGAEDVTRNMYVYEYQDQILLVDCGLGFPDETMLGVDLLLPDITYLLQNCMPEGKAKKKIVAMLLSRLFHLLLEPCRSVISPLPLSMSHTPYQMRHTFSLKHLQATSTMERTTN